MRAYKDVVYQPRTEEEIYSIVDSVNKAAKDTLTGRSGLVSVIGSYAPFFESSTFSNHFRELELPHDLDILFMPKATKNGERDAITEFYEFHLALGGALSNKGIISAPFSESNYGPEVAWITSQYVNGRVYPIHALYFPDESSLEYIMPPNQRPGLNSPMHPLGGDRDAVPRLSTSDKWLRTCAAEFQTNLSPLLIGRYPSGLLIEKFNMVIGQVNNRYGLGLNSGVTSLPEAANAFYEGLGYIPT